MSLIKRGFIGRYPQYNNYVAPFSQLYGQTTITSAAGERIDEWTTLGISTVMSCVSLLADTIASLPLRAYKVIDGKRVNVELPDVLRNPDPSSNSFEFMHTIVASMALHGNTYVHLDTDSSRANYGNLIGLTPLHPYQMQVLPNADQTGRTYLHLGNEISEDEMLHIRWFTPPQSLVGVSPLIQSRNMFGLALAMERHLNQFYAEGATPSSVIETPEKLTRENAETLVNTFTATHRRHRKPAVLSNGMKWRSIQSSAADQQLIDMREQVIRDIARLFRIPAHLILALGDNQTYQNVEQASLNFLTHTITPWLRRIEISLSKILPPGTDVIFDTSALLRTDALTRARVHALEITSGSLSPNEARQSSGREPYEGGDVFNQALAGTVTAGGESPALGVDSDTQLPIMGVLD